MPPTIPEENVFGEHDGSTCSATLCHLDGIWYFSRCAVDEHNIRHGVLDKEVPVNQPVAHAELIATYRRAEAEAAHKFGLIKTVAAKGPKAIQAAVETAAKAAKRRDSYAEKLAALGVDIKG